MKLTDNKRPLPGKFRLILAILLVIPIGMIIYAFFRPVQDYSNSLLNCAYALIALPILILNLWAWGSPRIIKAIFNLHD